MAYSMKKSPELSTAIQSKRKLKIIICLCWEENKIMKNNIKNKQKG